MLIRATLFTFGKPDSEGQVIRGPVDASRLEWAIEFNFSGIEVGQVVATAQLSDRMIIWADVSSEFVYGGCVPVAGIVVPFAAEPWEDVSLRCVSMSLRSRAILPADFEMEVILGDS